MATIELRKCDRCSQEIRLSSNGDEDTLHRVTLEKYDEITKEWLIVEPADNFYPQEYCSLCKEAFLYFKQALEIPKYLEGLVSHEKSVYERKADELKNLV